MARMEAEGANSPADVFLTTDAGRLWDAEQRGLLQKGTTNVFVGRHNLIRKTIEASSRSKEIDLSIRHTKRLRHTQTVLCILKHVSSHLQLKH